MISFEVLHTQNGTSDSFDSSEFSFIPENSQPADRGSGACLNGNFNVTNMQSALINSSPDLSVEEVEKRLVDLLEDNETLKKTLQANSKRLQTQMDSLSEVLHGITSSTSKQEASLQAAKENILQLERENSELREAVKHFEKESKSLSSYQSCSKCETEIQTDEETGYEIVHQKNSKDKEVIKQYRLQLNEAQDKIEELTQLLEKQNAEDKEVIKKSLLQLNKAQDKIEELTQLLEIQNAEMDSLRKTTLNQTNMYEVQQKETEALKSRNEIFENKLVLASSDAEKYKKRCDSLQQQLEECQTKLEQTQSSNGHAIQQLQGDVVNMQEILRQEKCNSQEARCKLSETSQKFLKLQSDYDRVSQLLQLQSIEQKEKIEKFDTMREREARAHLEQIDNLTAQLFDTQQKLEEQEEKVRKLVQQNTVEEISDDIVIVNHEPEDRFYCPLCNFGFTDLQAAENHVNSCIDQ